VKSTVSGGWLMLYSNFQYMFYGFAAAWVLIVIYALSMLARERRIKDEIARLKSMLEEKERR
jgi:CcmD family protein